MINGIHHMLQFNNHKLRLQIPSLPSSRVAKCKLKIISDTFLMYPLSLPRLHQPLCITPKCKFRCHRICHGNIRCSITTRCHCRGASSALPGSPHPGPCTWQHLLESKWVWGNNTKHGRRRTVLRCLSAREPPRIRGCKMAAWAWWGRRGKERMVLPGPGGTRWWVLIMIVHSRGSTSRGTQWWGDWSAYGTSVEVEVVGKLFGWARGEVF